MVAPAAPPAPQPGAAKTMFGYAAPIVRPGQMPGAPAAPQAPAPMAPQAPAPMGYPQQPPAPQYQQPPAPQGYPPPQQAPQGYPQQPPAPQYQQPPAPQGYPPPQQAPQGYPQQPPAPQYQQPPAPQGYPQQPPAPQYQQPPAPQGYPQQPPAPQYQQPPAPQYQQPPAPQGYPQQPPAPQGYPQQPPAPQYQQPPAPQGYPPPQQAPQGYAQPPQAQAYPPPAQDPAAAYQQNLPGPLDDIARAMPTSKPGTIFGFPVARLSDPGFQRLILLVAGAALLVSIFIPVLSFPTRAGSKLLFSWSSIDLGPISIGVPKFQFLIWPLLAGLAYLLVAVAPPHIRAKVPPVVLQWLPFTVAYIGVFISNMGLGVMGALAAMNPRGGGGLGAAYTMSTLAYPLLAFGLLARIARPTDQIARYIIAGGAALMIFPMFASFSDWDAGGLMTLVAILTTLMSLLAVFCGVFVVPPAKLPPALRAVDALTPLFTAILIGWLPVRVILTSVALPGDIGSMRLWMILHGVIPVVAYFFVLMMTAPAAYEAAMAMFTKGAGTPPPPQAPPGYPPPQGGGYPPPQGGGYPPPQGGGYPPPQGGGYPPPQ